MKNVICLLAAHNPNNIIGEYTLSIIEKLNKSCDVYYFADDVLSNSEIKRVVPYVSYADSVTHSGGDFGSWQYLTYYIGWKKLEQYQKIIVCNNKIDFSIEHLDDIYKYTKLNGYDFFAISDKRSSGSASNSYFLMLDNKVIKNHKFHEFWDNLVFRNKQESYKSVLPQYLTELGFYGTSYIKGIKKGLNKKSISHSIFPTLINRVNRFSRNGMNITAANDTSRQPLITAKATSNKNYSLTSLVKNLKSTIDIFKSRM